MKKQLSLFVATLATLFTFLTASAQGEWKWANYWSGTGGTSSDLYNNVTKTAFDEDGNIYVFGLIGGQPTYNGSPLMFINNPQVYGSDKRSSLLAKFDTLGNMLWYKVVKSSESHDCFPYWMEVKDNKVYISGDISLDYVEDPSSVNSVWLYYLDTLITGPQVHSIPADQRRPPYKTGRYTYFATLDLDGNLLDNHFVASFSRKIYTGGVRGEKGLCEPSRGNAPFHVDSEGNTFVFTKLTYGGVENDPYTLIVDGDTNKKYNIYLSGNVDPYGYDLNNGMVYKFSPDWELLYAKPMVNHTEGIATSWEWLQDSINPRYTLLIHDLSVDENDNMYISGHIELGLFSEFGGNLHQYPIHIYWDSTNYSIIQDITSSNPMGFVVKYDTNGIVRWSNQTFTQGSDYGSAIASWTGLYANDGVVIILGYGGFSDNNNGLVYFDDESNPLQRYQQSTSNQVFFARYNAQTGNYINHGVVPAVNALCGLRPTVVHNRVFACADIFSNQKICQWSEEGGFIQAIDFNASSSKDLSVLANSQGYLLLNMGTTSSVSFANGISTPGPLGYSSAVLALYHNPEFAQPFVPDDSVGISDYLDKREREIYLYPNPTDGRTTVCGYMYGYRSIELLDLQGRKLATLLDSPHGTSLPVIDLSPYPSGTYLVKINFERGVSVVRKVVRS